MKNNNDGTIETVILVKPDSADANSGRETDGFIYLQKADYKLVLRFILFRAGHDINEPNSVLMSESLMQLNQCGQMLK